MRRVATMAVVGAASMSTTASGGTAEPLEIVAVDVSAFPTIVVDVALPRRELAEQVDIGAFTASGVEGLVVERLAPEDLTVALVVDDGPDVPVETVAAHQGAAVELIRNLPAGVEVMIATTSGPITASTDDRDELIRAIAGLSTAAAAAPSMLGPAVVTAAMSLGVSDDGRRQLIVLTAEGIDVTAADAAMISDSLDQSRASLRVVAVGDEVGPNLERAALRSGGVAVAVPGGSGSVLRSVDILTTSLTDQYRLTATMTADDVVGVQLTVAGRTYETSIDGLRPSPVLTAPAVVVPTVPPSVASTAPPTTTSTTTSTTTTTAPAVTATGGQSDARAPSATAGIEAVVGVAAIAMIGAVIVRRRRQRVAPRGRSARHRR